jgi:hypothetical protein
LSIRHKSSLITRSFKDRSSLSPNPFDKEWIVALSVSLSLSLKSHSVDLSVVDSDWAWLSFRTVSVAFSRLQKEIEQFDVETHGCSLVIRRRRQVDLHLLARTFMQIRKEQAERRTRSSVKPVLDAFDFGRVVAKLLQTPSFGGFSASYQSHFRFELRFRRDLFSSDFWCAIFVAHDFINLIFQNLLISVQTRLSKQTEISTNHSLPITP